MKTIRTHLANILTSLRIVGAALLLFLRPLSPSFYVVYTLCGVTDVLDGFAARRLHTESALGARLDSIADLALYSVMLLKLLPILWPRLPLLFWRAVGLVLLCRLCSYAVAFGKYRRFASLHTYGNKLTGFLLFFLPYLLCFDKLVVPCCVICFVGGAASLEELLIHLTAKAYQPDRGTIFHVPGHDDDAA